MSRAAIRKIEEFFDHVAATPQPALQSTVATIRIDVYEDGEVQHWLLHIDHGRVTVSRRNNRPDAVLGADWRVFERVVTGEANALTAGLRGQLRMEGDTRLLLVFDRLLPGPPQGRTTLPPSGRRALEAARRMRAAGSARRGGTVSTAVATMNRRDRRR